MALERFWWGPSLDLLRDSRNGVLWLEHSIHDWFLCHTTSTKGKECGSVLRSCLWGGMFRDDTKNGCVAD